MNERKPLCKGVCDICHKEPAMIPFDSNKYCYRCWDVFWIEYRRRADNVEIKRQKKEKAREKAKEQAISKFLRN